MELKLEDYAQREGRIYYEIMREYAEGVYANLDFEIFDLSYHDCSKSRIPEMRISRLRFIEIMICKNLKTHRHDDSQK